MRESRSSGSVEGVMGNHDSYSDSTFRPAQHCGPLSTGDPYIKAPYASATFSPAHARPRELR